MHSQRLRTPVRRGRLLLLAVVVGALAVPAAAQATVTHATITSPGSPFIPPAFNADPGASNPTFTVTGTSDGTSGDTIDVECVYGDTNGGTHRHLWIGSISVNADGSWSSSPVTTTGVTSDSCNLVAVPHGTGASVDLSSFPGVPTFADFVSDTSVTSGGPNNGTQYDFEFDQVQPAAESYAFSVGNCPADMYPVTPGDFLYYNDVWDCAGGLYPSQGGLHPDRSELQVDGQDAYFPSAAGNNNLYSHSDQTPGLPTVSETHAEDSQGNVTTTDDETAFKCPGSSPSNYPPTSGNCSSYEGAGIHYHNTQVSSQNGQLINQTVVLSNTDSSSHTVDVRFDDNVDSNGNPAWQFPGGGWRAYSGGSIVTGLSGTGTLGVRVDSEYPDGDYHNPGGGLAWDTAPDRVLFANENEALLDYTRAIPAGGSVTFRFAYAVAPTAADAIPIARHAEDAFAPPQVSIASPGNGASFAAGTPITITGHAVDNVDVASLTVNGVAVGVNPDGSFSAPYAVKLGANPITVVVTDGAGNTASAAIAVIGTVAPKVAAAVKCVVPSLRKLTAAKARTLLARAHCRLGKTRKARSKKIKKGQIVASSPSSGKVLAANSAVNVTVSSGKPKKKHKKTTKAKKH